jgi:ADP-heptose:LPS heptosyltransferase
MALLVIRTSAMGDVALTVPVLKGVRKQYPSTEIIMVTRPAFAPFFTSVEGLRLICPDLKKRHNGFLGMVRLFQDINKQNQIDHVIDLHDVLRSKILRALFWISGTPVSVIDKGRGEKKRLISGRDRKQLKHSVERYCDVFTKVGYPVEPENEKWIVPSASSLTKISTLLGDEKVLNIGVAPYAKHKLKMWPEEYMVSLLEMISERHKCRFWLFGGKEDAERLEAFCLKVPGSFNLEGTLGLEEELAFMSSLDLMIAMDSSNMHMAALTGTKVISIWGGTDPLAGFGAWEQDLSRSVRIPADELTCRPCTVYGKGECKRGDFACMIWLTPEKVLERIEILNCKI